MQATLHQTILAAFLAFSFAAAEESPQITTSAQSSQETLERPSYSLTTNKLIFVSISKSSGPVTWDISGDSEAITTIQLPPSTPVVGIHEGQDQIAIHKSPDNARDTLLVVGMKPGTATIAAWGVQDQRAVKLAVIHIAVQGPRPPPPPPPPPPPIGKINHWVLVEETRQASANRGAILTEAIKWSRENKILWAVLDQNAVDPATGKPPEKMEGYIRDAIRDGLPRLYICNQEGETLWEGKPPDNPKDFLKLLEKHK